MGLPGNQVVDPANCNPDSQLGTGEVLGCVAPTADRLWGTFAHQKEPFDLRTDLLQLGLVVPAVVELLPHAPGIVTETNQLAKRSGPDHPESLAQVSEDPEAVPPAREFVDKLRGD